jgi:transcriptional regulator with XRE-family HTH domain
MNKNLYSKEHKAIIEKLKKARIDSGLDQNDVAELLGSTQSYISKVESGQRKIDIIQLKLFARIYKKTLRYFIN